MHDFVFSDHALMEMQHRNISKEIAEQVLNQPDRIVPVREGRVVYHKTMIAESAQKPLLYRVFVDTAYNPRVVVTAYATSKIAKYEVFQ